ncbi:MULTISPECIES: Rieske 2Fe-2S domain-containing protein [unclassified Sphingobium]|uniref:Rieske 2Fe-2S domain-containing protein n=1 Tax=unclassified Sphingobium TaxID=2611147 RepID=UPI002224892F|nr:MULTISPECIES: Rieske 2Fe-2S domain-containing protein [unclassified Sphingobium]MCW2351273.1 phenylpropionate dioxygenase-like ring-hydroxylating dioxygenase large terminal subunit [Sphingobium sp. B12D2B]MCW2370493.1 phenylpropionate dioxygenase-like ring-hydroxylating dioxygenase large terminal subunit [Sphingobium sp. B11D3D]MCW2395474.1 phenylpropionate dioxygenase-like ring-hydroxylating dioxygenase large terminal subunit [Sphingobium sp. B8D3B]MCW2418989.1 phenylpropionate dioxygenase-
MVSVANNELMTRVGPGTPMGTVMRQYWIPACASSEIAADGAPLRLMLLGEKLLAFRDTEGRVGVMDHRCPHRCASLFFGRNEKGGIRCVYHGWKFDVNGKCLDMPNVSEADAAKFQPRVHAKVYRTAERAGVVWVYMGERETPPPLPCIEATMLPDAELRVTLTQRECNWLQALEGDIDTSHFGFLHVGSVADEDVDATNMHSVAVTKRAPDFKVTDTDWGTMAGAYRPSADGEGLYWRICQYIFPFWALFPDGTFSDNVTANAWVPMDDSHTMVINFAWVKRTQPLRTTVDGNTIAGLEFRHNFLPNSSDWFGRWKLAQNAENDYEVDRTAQNEVSFTGVTGITLQDQYITESMGDIVDRSNEHLVTSDLMIMQTRKRIIKAARALQDAGTVPPGVDDPEIVNGARGGAYNAPADADWMEEYQAQLAAAIGPARG